MIGGGDGCVLPGPLATRDCMRQTAVDITALVKSIPAMKLAMGIHLDSSKVFYIGQSLGSVYGSMVSAIEPKIRASVLNVGGGSTVDIARLAQGRTLAIFYLGIRNPSLLNLPFGVGNPYNFDFDDSFVYYGQPPITNPVAGAYDIQKPFDVAAWIQMVADPLAYASRLTPKPVLFQFAKGDQEVPNPAASAFGRSEEHTSELQSHLNLVCRLLLEKKKNNEQQNQCRE